MSLIIHRKTQRGPYVVHDLATNGRTVLQEFTKGVELCDFVLAHFEDTMEDYKQEIEDLKDAIEELEEENNKLLLECEELQKQLKACKPTSL